MKPSAEDLRTSPHYRRLEADEVPTLEAYYHEGTGNTLFIVQNGNGKDVVVDQFAQLHDYGHLRLVWKLRESGFRKGMRNIFEGMATVLLFLGDPRLQAILAVAGVDYRKVTEFVEDLAHLGDREKVNLLVATFGNEVAQAVHEAMKEALADGVFTLEEWKEVQALAQGV